MYRKGKSRRLKDHLTEVHSVFYNLDHVAQLSIDSCKPAKVKEEKAIKTETPEEISISDEEEILISEPKAAKKTTITLDENLPPRNVPVGESGGTIDNMKNENRALPAIPQLAPLISQTVPAMPQALPSIPQINYMPLITPTLPTMPQTLPTMPVSYTHLTLPTKA